MITDRPNEELSLNAPFSVALPDFSGPMDLLVYLVRNRELDVGYIPVSAIALDYLNFLDRFDSVDLDQASEFILLAAILLQFKASSLLSGPEPETSDVEIPALRRERSLAELMALRETVAHLAELESRQIHLFDRGIVHYSGLNEQLAEEMLADVSVYDLAAAFRDLIENLPLEPTHVIEEIPFTLEGQMAFIISFFGGKKRLEFSRLAQTLCSRLAVIMTFLAMLELMRMGQIYVRQNQTFGPLILLKRDHGVVQ